MATDHPLVDIDAPGSWPEAVTEWVRRASESLEGSATHTADLRLPNEDDEDAFRALLSRYLVRSYHATRLLQHEVEGIQEEGLRPLSKELVRTRLALAERRGYLSSSESEELLSHSTASEQGREGQVCLFLGDEPMHDQYAGLWNLMTMWGGEAIYGDSMALRDRLRTIGDPTIVVAALDLSPGWRTHQIWPELAKLFVGRILDLEGGSASVHYSSPILPDKVLAIWQPGDPPYERYAGLPSH